MSNLTRKITRRQKKRDVLEKYNAQLQSITSSSKNLTHHVYLHPTKGYKHFNKKRVAISHMTKADRWNKIAVPMIIRASARARS